MKKKLLILGAVWVVLLCLLIPTSYFLGVMSGRAKVKESAATVMENAVPYNFTIADKENPDYEYYSCAVGYKGFYTYGEGIKDNDVDSIIMELVNWVPNTFQQFMNDNGTLIICNDNFTQMISGLAKDSVLNTDADGVYFISRLDNKSPVICIDYSLYQKNDLSSFFIRGYAEIHEFAHYMDDLYEGSATEEFETYFEQYAALYKPLSPVVPGYQNVSKREFFAILVTDIIRCNDITELNLPDDLLSYMGKILYKAENININ